MICSSTMNRNHKKNESPMHIEFDNRGAPHLKRKEWVWLRYSDNQNVTYQEEIPRHQKKQLNSSNLLGFSRNLIHTAAPTYPLA